jgi:hypothetical protein
VFRKFAEPEAIAATNELTRISLDPVTLELRPEKSLRRSKATETEDPTAAEYPKARSLFV